jgi:hypothetical protein
VETKSAKLGPIRVEPSRAERYKRAWAKRKKSGEYISYSDWQRKAMDLLADQDLGAAR